MNKINQISVDGVVYDIATKKEVELEAKIGNKADKATTLDGYGITDAYTKDSVNGMLSQKNDILTFDTTPTADSTNPVTSGGVKVELDKKAEKSDIFSSRGVGVQIGENSKASNGVSIGYNSQSGQYTVAIGNGAKGDGVSIGTSAQCYDGTKYINAIQIGTGTNSEEKTAQFYDYKIMKSDGNIPVERLTELKKLSVPHTTASGYPVSVSDHLEGERVIDYKVYGNSVQDGTPTPDTPIEIQSVGDLVTDTSNPYYGKYDIPVRVSGKNLIPYPYKDTSGTAGGITITINNDGTITANGTASADRTFTIAQYTIQSGTYTLSGTKNGSLSTYYMGISGTSCRDVGDGGSVTFDTEKTILIYISIKSGATLSNVVFKPQLEFGSTATQYEPYQAPITKHIYLDEPLRKVGDYADYVDYENQRVVRQIEVLDSTGTKIIDESFGLLATPTTEPITVPELVVPQSGTMNISATTSIKPSKLDLTYYQDINKVITELKNAILAQGGNV